MVEYFETFQWYWATIYASVIAGLCVFGMHRMWMICAWYYYGRKKPEIQGEFKETPVVTVQLPVFNELYVAERLVRAVAEFEWPKDKLEIQVLDDSTDETTQILEACVEALKKDGLDIKLIHRANREGYKAGALEHGMHLCRGEFIAVFDADFVPQADFLKETVPFFADEKVGMVQTRWGHLNEDYNFLTRIQAILLDGHFLVEQSVRNMSQRFFNFNGTAGLWRKSTIFDAGGWQHDTLTEDLDLSYRAQLNGWKGVFVPWVKTPAELPVDMNGFKSQQFRWAKGAVQTCLKLIPRLMKSDQPLYIKLESFFHLTANFAFPLLLLLSLLTGSVVLFWPELAVNDATLQRVLTVDLPVFALASLSLFIFYGTTIICTKRAGFLGWKLPFYIFGILCVGIGISINNTRAVFEALMRKASEFTRTPKYGIQTSKCSWSNKKYASRSMVPFFEFVLALAFLGFALEAWSQGIWNMVPYLLLYSAGFGYAAIWSLGQGKVSALLLEPLRIRAFRRRSSSLES